MKLTLLGEADRKSAMSMPCGGIVGEPNAFQRFQSHSATFSSVTLRRFWSPQAEASCMSRSVSLWFETWGERGDLSW